MTSPTAGYREDENGLEVWVCPRCTQEVGPERVLVQGQSGMEGWHPEHYGNAGT